MAGKKKFYGFGYAPSESQHHFLVEIPKSKDDSVIIYERFLWQDDEEVQQLQDFRDHLDARNEYIQSMSF